MPLLPVPSTDLGSWNRRTSSVTGNGESTESQNARRRLLPNLPLIWSFWRAPSPKLLPDFHTTSAGRHSLHRGAGVSGFPPLGTIGAGKEQWDPRRAEGIGSPGHPKPDPGPRGPAGVTAPVCRARSGVGVGQQKRRGVATQGRTRRRAGPAPSKAPPPKPRGCVRLLRIKLFDRRAGGQRVTSGRWRPRQAAGAWRCRCWPRTGGATR